MDIPEGKTSGLKHGIGTPEPDSNNSMDDAIIYLPNAQNSRIEGDLGQEMNGSSHHFVQHMVECQVWLGN